MQGTMTSRIQPHNVRPAAVWSAGGGEYDQISRGIADSIEHAVMRLDPRPGERILDPATGTGWTSRVVVRRGATVTGVDIAGEVLTAAQARARAERLPIEYQIGDAEDLPFDDGTFDAVISTCGIMFATRPEAAAAELARVCRKGGRVALTTWLSDSSVFEMFTVMRRYMRRGTPSRAATARRRRWRTASIRPAATRCAPTSSPFTTDTSPSWGSAFRVSTGWRLACGCEDANRYRQRVSGFRKDKTMTRDFRSLLATAVIVLGFTASMAMAQGRPSRIDLPAVPPALEVPDGYSVFFKGEAAGTQNFVCLQTTSGITWAFLGPQATLFQSLIGDFDQQNATHFLSANPVENNLPRPTWQHSFDTSRVWARAVASSSDADYVEAGAIPWLLLQATGAAIGPTGGGTLAQTAYIHRLSTSGGVAPTTGCSQTTDVGKISLVPYTADYYFYRAKRHR